MSALADIEVEIDQGGPGAFSVRVRHSSAVSETYEIDIVPRGEDVRFDPEKFRARSVLPMVGIDVEAYGRELWNAFFSGAVEDRIEQAIAALMPGDQLRLRLFLGPGALDLHDLLWEALPDPTAPENLPGATLSTSEKIIFSRYLSTQNWQRVQLRRKERMRALVVIADPSDIHRWSGPGTGTPLGKIDVDEELARAEAGLERCGAEVEARPSKGSATLLNIVSAMKEGDGYDILYLVCHGQIVDKQPMLWLEKEDGTADVVAGDRFVSELRRIEQQPRLIILASCMSAGGDHDRSGEDRGAVTAIGPHLASNGVPAVLAMQGNITMETLESFMPAFFENLNKTGRVDQAVAAARAVVSRRPDAWLPVLFMRLRTGRVWYVPGMMSHQSNVAWASIVTNICQQRCTVILGSGLLDNIIGSPRRMAQRWVQERKYPLQTSDTDDLPQVAQYVAVQEGNRALRESLGTWMWEEMWRLHGKNLPADLKADRLSEVMSAVGQHLRQTDTWEVHKVLARLPFPVYITTNPDNILADSLREVQRAGFNQLAFSWRESGDGDVGDRGSVRSAETTPVLHPPPTWNEPLVYHLFGHFGDPETILLTEDDYFDYLIQATRRRDLIPSLVRDVLADRTLLFVGFQITEWDFRVLLRIIVNQSGGRFPDYQHVAVQIDPEDDRIQDPEWTRRYLEKYLASAGIGSKPTVYWGSTSDFVKELSDRWVAKYGAFPTYPFDGGDAGECTCDPTVGVKTRATASW